MIEVFFLLLALGFLALPFLALSAARHAGGRCRELGEELQRLREQQVLALEREQRLARRIADLEAAGREGPPRTASAAAAASTPVRSAAEPSSPNEAKPRATPPPAAEPAAALILPPPLPGAAAIAPPPSIDTPKPAAPVPAPLPVAESEHHPAPLPVAEPALHMERFMGAKLFAWIGGLALFLGILFFVKLSLERGWISPALRTWTGLAVGAGLVGAGLRLQRNPRQTALAQTLCATGIVALYGVAFAAHALWRIPPFHLPLVTFAFLSAVTAAAFTLAVRHHAQVVAVLGMLGGFLTPVLCSTGEDRPFALFSYIALLDLGVLAVAQRRRWAHLTPLAAAGTLMTLIGWLLSFFRASEYGIGSATWLPVGLLLGFPLLFALAAEWMRRRGETGQAPAWAALGLAAGALLVGFSWLQVTSIATRPWVLYSLVLGLNALALGLVAWQPPLRRVQTYTATLTFLHLLLWTSDRLSTELLLPALGVYLGFGVLHSAFAAWLQRRQPMPLTGWLPLLTVALLLLPVLQLPNPGLALWPALLLADLLVIGLAWLTGALLPVLAALALTLLAIALWLFVAPSSVELPLGLFLTLVASGATVFAFAGQRLARRFPKALTASLLPASSALLPFLLLIMATGELRLADPTPVFGLALALGVFLLGLVRAGGATVLAPAALAGALALQQVWLQRGFTVDHAGLAVLWQLGYLAVFSAFPFVFRRRFATETLPWITAAAASLGTFGLMHQVVIRAWPNEVMGLVPAAFALLPAAGLAYVKRQHPLDNPARLDQLAWFGGTTLFFVTLIFPLQFDRQWLTLGWACEGAALCWLFGRVPHPGLRATGAVLLVTAFARLAVLPLVSAELVRGALPILNWPLYTYGLTTLALFLAAAWLRPPGHLWGEANLRSVFRSLAGVLLFLLLNFEIADAFTTPGERVFVFDFGGHLARDMTYSLAWALFAFGLLVLGLWRRHPGTRYAGIGLLGATVLKLFLHDLARIDSGWRVGALVGVALVALAVSYLYQRWLGDDT
jgi:hypothetical protein